MRELLKTGRPVIGTWLNSGSPVIAQLLAESGLDFVCVDAEHSPIDVPQAFNLFQAIRASQTRCAPIVRLHGVDYPLVKRYLDAGARGVICPFINTRTDAELLVSATRFPPAGLRGVGFCSANGFGARVQEEFASANDQILVAVQIEHIRAVQNIDEILSVPGIDAAFIGPYDLSASMGLTGQFDHPDFQKARDGILAACARHGITPGIHVVQPDLAELHRRLAEGYKLLAYSLDITILTCEMRKLASEFPRT